MDGGSSDGTGEVISDFVQTHANFRLMNNRGRIQPKAFNIAVRVAAGDIIVRLDAHARYPAWYLSRCVETLRKRAPPWWVAAGTPTPEARGSWPGRLDSAVSRGLALAGPRYRVGGKAGPVDTVPFGAYRREVFDKIGYFNERLVRGEDNEFNGRVRAAGMTVWFNPEIYSTYFARPGLQGHLLQQWGNGLYHFLTLAVNPSGVSARHFVPFVFVATLLAAALGGFAWAPLWGLMAGVFGLYMAANLCYSLPLAAGNGLQFAFVLPWLFLATHLDYGIATLFGGLKFGAEGLRRFASAPVRSEAPSNA